MRDQWWLIAKHLWLSPQAGNRSPWSPSDPTRRRSRLTVTIAQPSLPGTAPHIWAMQQHLDLSDDESAALIALITLTIDGDRYPPSPRIGLLREM